MMGTTVTHIKVSKDVRVTDANVVSAHPIFAKYVVAALKQWQFIPSEHEYAFDVTCRFEFYTENQCVRDDGQPNYSGNDCVREAAYRSPHPDHGKVHRDYHPRSRRQSKMSCSEGENIASLTMLTLSSTFRAQCSMHSEKSAISLSWE
jgi:Gram-negative bacterial TonB protein C-terminal